MPKNKFSRFELNEKKTNPIREKTNKNPTDLKIFRNFVRH